MARKPTLVQRYKAYSISMTELNEMIRRLEAAYENTGDGYIMSVVEWLKSKRAMVRDNEIMWTEKDIQEILDKPYLFPHSVVTWAAKYRDAELSS